MELKVTEKIRLKIREDIQTTTIEVTTSFSNVADEEHFFFTQADKKDESEQHTREGKEQTGQNAKQWVANQELFSLKTRVKGIAKNDGKNSSYSMKGIRANARTRVEQDVDLVLKDMKLIILSQPHDDVLTVTDSLYKNNKPNEDRILLKDSLLFRNYFGEANSVIDYQFFSPSI